MTDHIVLQGISARGFHGVLAAEKRDGQDFVVDVVMTFDTVPAAATDDLTSTVDYAAVAAAVVADVEGQPVDLVETLAARIAASVLAEPLVDTVEVTVHKPEAPVGVPFHDVSVTIRRTKESGR